MFERSDTEIDPRIAGMQASICLLRIWYRQHINQERRCLKIENCRRMRRSKLNRLPAISGASQSAEDSLPKRTTDHS